MPKPPVKSSLLLDGQRKHLRIAHGKIAAFADRRDTSIHCLSGALWVTIENDVMDHVLRQGDQCLVPTERRVVISGAGVYALESSDNLPIAS